MVSAHAIATGEPNEMVIGIEGEVVLIVQGSSARFTDETKKLPVDCTIIGIVDTVTVGDKTIFKNNE